ncbi:MAG: Thioredoxin reductase [Promethearchaeota archaeon]|nr:MAG: Thioredoxin reductase [Candidatus Lokiarchaeota archaeon]
MEDLSCEVLIIGAGPAGCTAGVYCGRGNRDTIILNGKDPSALERTKEIQNWVGEERITGPELLKKFQEHATSYENVNMIKGDVISLMAGMGTNMISTRTTNITADAVIIATGRGQRNERIKGEEALIGYGVSYCALCDGPLYKERNVYLYGDDEELLEDALILEDMGTNTHIITEADQSELPKKVDTVKNAGIEVLDNTEVIEIIGDSQGVIQKIKVRPVNSEDETEIKEIELACLFIFSHTPSNSIFKKAGIDLDEKNNIIVDEEQKTNVEGVYAAGDVTGGLFQVIFAAAEGAKAGINASKYVRHLKREEE